AQSGWIGLGLIVIGIGRSARRAPVMLAWFLLPALLFFVFYAYMQMHTRYFLTTMVFLAPFAGYGADGLITLVLSRIPSHATRARAQLASVIICFAIAGVSLANVTRHLNPWGPDVSRAEIHAWQNRVSALTPGADGRVRIVLEQRCRYLEDVLLGYTDAELMDPKAIDQWGENWAPAHYFKPLDRGALYATPQWLEHLQVFAHRSIASRHNLLPVSAGQGTSNIVLGRGHFEQMDVRPWRLGPHLFSFAMPSEGDAVLWVDLGCSPEPVSATLELLLENGTVALEQQVFGPGFSVIHIPAGLLPPGSARGRLSGEEPLPSNPVVDCLALGEGLFLDMGRERPLSANLLFPSLKPQSVRLYPVRVKYMHGLKVVAPTFHAEASITLHARFHYNNTHEEPLWVMCDRDNDDVLLRDIHSGVGSWSVPIPSGDLLRLQLVRPTWPGRVPHLVLNGVEIWAEKSNRSE
ncbi:MAG: hypothetical protein ACI856_002753, partial [Kiritimatiellia bacterium]